MKSGLKWAITLLVFPLVLALPAAAQTDPTATDTTVTDATVLTDTTVTTETTLTETSSTDLEPTDTESTTTYYEEDADDDAEEGAKVCAACAAFGIALPLILLGISIAIAFWIYRDAKERGITSAPLWAILGFLFNILGLVIYLIARKNMQPPSSSVPGSTMPPPPPPV